MRFDASRGRPGRGSPRDARRDRAARHSSSATARSRSPEDRARDRTGPAWSPRSRPPTSSPAWWSGTCPARRVAGAASTPRHASSRPCGSRSTPSSTHSRKASRPAWTCCGPAGRLVVLSYHSLEDRIVKRFIEAERKGCICPPELPVCVCGRNPRLRRVGPSSITPTAAEVAANPRSRSARLRAAERLAA